MSRLFPVLQLFAFSAHLLAVVGNYFYLSLFFMVLSVVCFNFTVHIYVHEFAHARVGNPIAPMASKLLSLLIGLPFEGFCVHHLNHHRFNNCIGDISSTWVKTCAGLRPRGLFFYALTWPVQIWRTRQLIRANEKLKPSTWQWFNRSELKQQQVIICIFLVGAFLLGWHFFLGYLLMVTLGFSLVSLHNYVQHPPVLVVNKRLEEVVTSYHGKLYNAIFSNNGLHDEHHRNPGMRAHQLFPRVDALTVTRGHIFLPRRVITRSQSDLLASIDYTRESSY